MKCSYTLHSGLAAHSSQKAHKGFSFRVLLNADQKVNEILLEWGFWDLGSIHVHKSSIFIAEDWCLHDEQPLYAWRKMHNSQLDPSRALYSPCHTPWPAVTVPQQDPQDVPIASNLPVFPMKLQQKETLDSVSLTTGWLIYVNSHLLHMRRKRVAAGGKAESLCSRRPHLPGWAAAVRRYQSWCQNTLTVPSWLPFAEAKIGLDMTNGSFLRKDWCPLACTSAVLFSVWYVVCCPWIMNFSSSSSMETNEVFPSLVLLKLLTEHSIKLLIFASFHFSGFEALFQNVPWQKDLIWASSSLI